MEERGGVDRERQRWRRGAVVDERGRGGGGGDRLSRRWWRREVELVERGRDGGEGRRWRREAEVEVEEIG